MICKYEQGWVIVGHGALQVGAGSPGSRRAAAVVMAAGVSWLLGAGGGDLEDLELEEFSHTAWHGISV
jgi:hypothetical protein